MKCWAEGTPRTQIKETKPSVQLLLGPGGERDRESTGEALSRPPCRLKEGVTAHWVWDSL